MIRLCAVDDVPLGEGRAVLVSGRRLAVFRAGSGWYALDARCPHLSGPLADGIVAERTVICPLHERRFDLATGREEGGDGLCVASHALIVEGSDIYLKEADMEQTIYEQIGGAPAVAAAVDGFYERVWSDPDLIPYFPATDKDRLKDHQRAFITTALGGPEAYAGRSMAEAHRGRGITDGAFDRVVEHLADTLAELSVPAATIETIAGALAPLRGEIVEGAAASAA
jgi:hemoglobin